jgi:hypothetical protein
MSRSTQNYGLPEEAREFIDKNVATIVEECPYCKGTGKAPVIKGAIWQDASHLGMFEDGPSLLEYSLKDGRVVREEHQATQWSSGPCIFLKLTEVTENGGTVDLFTWPQAEINNA